MKGSPGVRLVEARKSGGIRCRAVVGDIRDAAVDGKIRRGRDCILIEQPEARVLKAKQIEDAGPVAVEVAPQHMADLVQGHADPQCARHVCADGEITVDHWVVGGPQAKHFLFGVPEHDRALALNGGARWQRVEYRVAGRSLTDQQVPDLAVGVLVSAQGTAKGAALVWQGAGVFAVADTDVDRNVVGEQGIEDGRGGHHRLLVPGRRVQRACSELNIDVHCSRPPGKSPQLKSRGTGGFQDLQPRQRCGYAAVASVVTGR